MKKLRLLRDHLQATLPDLARDPDRLAVYAERGTAHTTLRSPSRSYSKRYTAVVVVTDFGGDADALLLSVMVWLRTHQPDTPVDQAAITFEAELLDNGTADLELQVELTEAVRVTVDENGQHTLEHLEEPRYADPITADSTEPLLSEWQPLNNQNG